MDRGVYNISQKSNKSQYGKAKKQGLSMKMLRTQARAGKIVGYSQRKIPLLQGFSSLKTVHRTVFKFTFFGAHAVFSGAPPPYPCKPFEKGLTENFYFLDKT